MWREVVRRSGWLSAGSAVGRLLPFGVLILLGRRLDSGEFASLGVGFAWTAAAAALTTSGLATVATQRLALVEPSPAQRTFVRHVVVVGAALATTLAVLATLVGPQTVSRLFGGGVRADAVVPALVAGALWSLVMLSVAVCNGLHRPRPAAAVLGGAGLLQGMGMALGQHVGDGAAGALWGVAAGNLLALSWAALLVQRIVREAGTGEARAPRHEPRERLAGAVAWSTAAAAAVMPVTLAAGALVAGGADGTRQLAAFMALEQVHQIAIYLPAVLGQALLPVLAVHLDRAPAETTRQLVRVALLLSVVGSAVAAALAWQPAWLHVLLANPALDEAPATRAMLLNAGLALALSLLGGALLAAGRYRAATLMNVAWGAAFLLLGLLWRDDGAAGLQAARLAASWALVLAASAALWLGVAGQRTCTARS